MARATGRMSATEAILKERGARYGKFEDQARISQNLLRMLRSEPGWQNLSDDQKEALTIICIKEARIINGDPNWADSWRDIAGYAELVAKRLEGVSL